METKLALRSSSKKKMRMEWAREFYVPTLDDLYEFTYAETYDILRIANHEVSRGRGIPCYSYGYQGAEESVDGKRGRTPAYKLDAADKLDANQLRNNEIRKKNRIAMQFSRNRDRRIRISVSMSKWQEEEIIDG